MRIKVGDTAPPIVATLTDGYPPQPINLTVATNIRVVLARKGVVIDSADGYAGNAQGQVTRPWKPGETDEAGQIDVELIVTWANGTKQTFPPEGYLPVVVTKDLEA